MVWGEYVVVVCIEWDFVEKELLEETENKISKDQYVRQAGPMALMGPFHTLPPTPPWMIGDKKVFDSHQNVRLEIL